MVKFLAIGMLFIGCAQYFDPKIGLPGDQPIIIDALLTDELKNHEVTLTRAKYINDFGQISSIDDAEVYLEDSEGATYTYSFVENGTYVSESVFAGQKNLQYRLVVIVDSEEYVSDFEAVPESIEIAAIRSNFVYEVTQDEPGVFSKEPRVEFLIDMELSAANHEGYFRFDWQATYRAETPDQGDTICWVEHNMDPPTDLPLTETCYVTESPTGFLQIFSSEGIDAGTTIEGVKVYSIFPNKRFQDRYSPEITVYAINDSAYNFWKLIYNQTENVGGLFDPELGPISGNIQGVSATSKRVIGVFEVASVVKKRDFFARSVVPIFMLDYEDDCVIPPLVLPDGTEKIIPRPLYCCDCTLLPNCSNVKPEFWQP